MEESYMEKMNTTLTQDEIVMELIRLLKENQIKDKANDILESAIYVDGLEKKLDQVVTELNAVKKNIVDLQEQQMMKSIKAQLAIASERMEAFCNSMKEQLFEVKTEFKEKATSIVTEVKAKGKEALNRVSEFLGVKEKLEKLRINVREAGIEIDKTIAKIDHLGKDIRESSRTVSNAFRTFADKEKVDYSEVERSFSKTEVIKKPWEWKRRMFAGMELRLDATIDKLDNLSKDILLSKTENYSFEKVNEVVCSPGVIPMVAENMGTQYGSEAFEVFQKQFVNKEASDQILNSTFTKDGITR
jgi:hypothetical protein